jgi:hypothetical protein
MESASLRYGPAMDSDGPFSLSHSFERHLSAENLSDGTVADYLVGVRQFTAFFSRSYPRTPCGARRAEVAGLGSPTWTSIWTSPGPRQGPVGAWRRWLPARPDDGPARGERFPRWQGPPARGRGRGLFPGSAIISGMVISFQHDREEPQAGCLYWGDGGGRESQGESRS